MKQIKRQFLIYLACIISSGCSLIWQTVKIEVPNGFVGWVYVIPVTDTSGVRIEKLGSKYQIDENGIAYVPFDVLNIKKDSRILVYEENSDISDDMRYAGSVVKSSSHSEKKYEYIQFYLPSKKERKIANSDQYWRDKSWEYEHPASERFDSLLDAGEIVFQ